MAQILIRDLDPKVVDRLKERAKSQGRSLQSEVRSILEQSAQVDRRRALSIARRIRRQFGNRTFSDSADLIRKDRER